MTGTQSVASVLTRLAEMTTDEIVAWMVELGVDGDRNSCAFCPLARLIFTLTGVVVSVSYLPSPSGWVRVQDNQVVPLPRSAVDVAKRFDAGELAQLERKSA